ncbi:WHG domain-containing protein [Paracoccus caeni]|uniref:WHG domain-containing protein n=1 Tax=Paracoccus caeni TaxID=657651 RepID=A0A934SHX0_9RHOB|nr:WHG domain-containing protein [Paracoccus caeni]
MQRRGGSIYSKAVEATTTLISETGQMPSVGEVASSIDVPETELIQLFPDMTHLIGAMAESALMLLQDLCIRIVVEADSEDPVAQFEALACAYVEWAYTYPREFRIIGAMPATQFEGSEKLVRYEKSIHDLMLKLLRRAQAKQMLAETEDLHSLVAIAHTYAYGVASKMLVGDLARWLPGRHDRDAARVALSIFIRKVLR